MNKIKIIYIFFIFLGMQVSVFAQSTIQDAVLLKNKAKTSTENSDYENSIQFLNNAIEILTKFDEPQLEGECFFLLANNYSLLDEQNYALKYYLKSEENFIKTNNKEYLRQVYQQLGLIYYNIKAYPEATHYLKKSLEVLPNNSNKYTLLSVIGNSYFNSYQYDSAMFFYNEMQNLALAQNDNNLYIKATEKIISVNKKQNNYDKAIENNYKLYDLYVEQKNNLGIALTLNNVGYNYVLLEKYEEATEAFKQALIYFEDANSLRPQIANTNKNIGICLQNSGNTEEAIKHLSISENLWRFEENYEELASVQNLIALIYLQSGDLYNASTFSFESITYAEKSDNMEVRQNCYQTYSLILQEGNDYQNALDYYKKYLSLRDSILLENRLKEQELSKRISDLERTEKELKLKLAEEEIQDILLEQLQLENEKQEKENEILRQQKELKEAELLQNKYALVAEKERADALRKQQEIEALENEKMIKDLELQQNQAEAEKNQKEIELLESEKEIQKLALEKNEANKKRMRWIGALFMLILLLIIIFLLYTRHKNRKLKIQSAQILEQNNELNSQKNEIQSQTDELMAINEEMQYKNQELEKKHIQITDSITYASRIQNAMLPDNSILAAFFPNHFVVYRPKDIVSGDFYWSKEIVLNGDKIIFFAVADCTGHGVPGAFVSMLGMSLLNEIVSKHPENNPGQILNTLRDEIKTSLKQHSQDSESKDGMDIAMCKVNKENGTLQYAGAYNPLYIVRDKKYELSESEIAKIGKKKVRIFEQKDQKCHVCLTEIKADFQPIGVYINERSFANIELKIHSKDRLYIFSDGFVDQFGGQNNQKYQSVNFKNFLIKIQENTMNKQKKLIEQEFDRWTSEYKFYEQIDDILIVGVEI